MHRQQHGLVHIVGPGTCGVRALQSGNALWNAAPNVNQSFAIGKGAQSIAFGTIPGHVVGDPDFTVAATATSGLAVRFVRFIGNGVCTVSTAGLIHIVGPGTCGVRASQAGNALWNAAPNVNQTFVVGTQILGYR